MKRLAGLVAAMVLMGALVSPPAIGAPRLSVLTAAGSSSQVLRMAAQSTTVTTGHVWSLDLDVPAAVRATDHIDVTIYPRLMSRIAFDAAAAGHFFTSPSAWSTQSEMLKTAKRARNGSIEVRIPVDKQATGNVELPGFYPGTTEAGVYPVVVQTYSQQGVAVGTPLSTFLVYSPPQTGAPRLSVSLTIGINAPPKLSRQLVAVAPGAASVAGLSALVATLGRTPGTALTLDVTPQTLDALSAGSAAEKSVVATLRSLVGHGDELAPAPYVSVSLSGLYNAGLSQQVEGQLGAGADALQRDVGQKPQTSTWISTAPIDIGTLQLLMSAGLKQLILPDDDLTALPAAFQTTTYARPTSLHDGITRRGAPLVVGADPVLSDRLKPSDDPVLSAEQTLAELAMIQLETPSTRRGVAILAPSGTTIPAQLLSTLLSGLRRNPFARAVTASGLFAAVPAQKATPAAVTPSSGTPSSGTAPSGTASSGTAPQGTSTPATTTPTSTAGSVPGVAGTAEPPVRSLVGKAAKDVALAGAISGLSGLIDSVASVVPDDTSLLNRSNSQLLLSESDQITTRVKGAVIASATKAIGDTESQIKLLGATSVTLTARNVHLPLTIESVPKLAVHIELVLTSPKLLFKRYRPPDGSCTSSSAPNSETCQLVLHAAQTTLKVPVEARTTGVFSLDLAIYSPNDSITLASARDTVRSTAVSAVGWVLIFGALFFLGIWWIRDIRSGRRARQLVRRPGDDADDGGDDDPGSGGGLDPAGGAPAASRSGFSPQPDGVIDARIPVAARSPGLESRARSAGMSPSSRQGGHNGGAAVRRSPEERPT